MDQRLYTVGETAKICNLSTQQLRYYDKQGILSPSYRDKNTGYRYYTENQFPVLAFLYDLKRIGLSNDSIRSLMEHRDASLFAQELTKCLSNIDEEIKACLEKYNYVVKTLLRTNDALSYLRESHPDNRLPVSYDISLIRVPISEILYTRYPSDWRAQNSPVFAQRFAEINKLVEEHKLVSDGTKMAILHHGALKQFSEADGNTIGDYEVATRLEHSKDLQPRDHVRSFGGFEAVSAIHVGAFTDADRIYHAMYAWAEDRGLELEDTSVEEYWINSFVSDKKENYVYRIYIPLRGSII